MPKIISKQGYLVIDRSVRWLNGSAAHVLAPILIGHLKRGAEGTGVSTLACLAMWDPPCSTSIQGTYSPAIVTIGELSDLMAHTWRLSGYYGCIGGKALHHPRNQS